MFRLTVIHHPEARTIRKARPIAPSLALVFLAAALLAPGTCSSSPAAAHTCLPAEHGSGWDSCGVDPALLTETCTLERIPADAITWQQFERIYREQRPVIIVENRNDEMRQRTTRQVLLQEFGDVVVTLSTANTVSHEKTPTLFRDYLEGLEPHSSDQLGNETLYLFGPNSELGFALGPLIEHYRPPTFAESDLAYSFGIGASGSGVPFHVHGQGWSEVIHGRKRWLLYPPEKEPLFDPDVSSLAWLHNVYPTLQGNDSRLLEDCVVEHGEALYFPSMWWHATLNIGESVFMSSFESKQVVKASVERYSYNK